MREVLKSDGTKAITTNSEPKAIRRLKEEEMITTANIAQVQARRKAEAEAAAAKAKAEQVAK